MNLLDLFVLQHIQVSELHAELIRVSKEGGTQDAKVELNLTPRLLKTDAGVALPAYQVSARLSCRGGTENQPGPIFTAQAAFEALYQQTSGEPMDIAQFTSNHSSLTRQLYPLLQHELRGLLSRLGLEQIHLPYDLASRMQTTVGEPMRVPSALH